MKNIFIPKSALVGIFIAIVSLCVVVVNVSEIVLFYNPWELDKLADGKIKVGRYAKGMISECVTVPLLNNPNILSGSDSGFVSASAITYDSYTVPISGEQFIRVWLYDSETKKAMERIVGGDIVEVFFEGKIQKGGALNREWYSNNPEFDQSKVVTDYVIWQKNVELEKHLCLAGIYGIVIAALLYYFSGGIQIEEEQPKRKPPQKFIYDEENKDSDTFLSP